MLKFSIGNLSGAQKNSFTIEKAARNQFLAALR